MAARAVLCTDVSDFTTWRVVTTEKPPAPEGKVVVKMSLVPINPTDILTPKMQLRRYGPNKVVPGSEGVGFVAEVGANVTKVKKGQRVIPLFMTLLYEEGKGSWQDYVVVSEDELFVPPATMSDETAAQFRVNPWTVYGLISQQNLSKGDYLLQGAAGSVLGRMVIQLAKHWGIKTINVVRRDDATEELKSLGANEVINSSTEGARAQGEGAIYVAANEIDFDESIEHVLERVKEITGGKLADGALDPVAGTATKVMASCVKNGGKVFIYGILGTKDNTATVNIFDLGRVDIKFWRLFQLMREQTPVVLSEKVSKLLEEKVMEPLTGQESKLEEFKEAVIASEKSGRGGKVLLRL